MPQPLITRLALLSGIALAPSAGFAQTQMQHDGHASAGSSPAVLGKVHFAASCSPEAQTAFDDAMKLQHSFWYQASSEAFRRVLVSRTRSLWV